MWMYLGDTDLGRLCALFGFVTISEVLSGGSFPEENEKSFPLMANARHKKKVQKHARTREHNNSLSLL